MEDVVENILFDVVHPARDLHLSPPLDFSFRNLTELLGALKEKPRCVRIGQFPEKNRNRRYITRSLWLGHNSLKSATHIVTFVQKFIEQPSALKWLDLSYNLLCDIDEELLELSNLMILYLHSNKIKSLLAVAKLKKMGNLRILTLHANPLERVPGYRFIIIGLLPQVISLDYAKVSDYERTMHLPPGYGAFIVRQFNKPPSQRSLSSFNPRKK